MSQANIKAVITAEDRASATLNKFGASAGNVGDKIAASAKGAALALVAATSAASLFGIKSAADFQQTRVGLENMLGSADKARTLLKDISDFAATTPFEFPELASATRQLVAFGFSADDAFKTMQNLGDVSAAVGAPIEELAYLMGTLKTQGRAFTIDIRQFAQRGIPIYEYLAKVLKTNEQNLSAMIEEGKVGFPEVQKAFQLMTGEGGKFNNTMEAQSKTLNGTISTLKDNFGILLRNLVGINEQGDVVAGGAFEKIANVIGKINQYLTENEGKITAFATAVKEKVGDVAVRALELFRIAWTYLKPPLEQLWNTIVTSLLPSLKELWKQIEPLSPLIGTILLAALIGAIVALTNFIKVLSFLITTVAKVIEVLGELGSWIGQHLGEAIVKVLPYINMVIGWFNTLKSSVASVYNYIANLNWGGLVTGIGRGIGNAIIAMIERAVNTAVNIPGVPDVKIPRFNKGVENFKGGLAYVHQGEVLTNLPPGTDVIPKSQVGNGGGDNMNITIQVGAFMGSEMDARRFAEKIMNAYSDLKQSNLTMGVPR